MSEQEFEANARLIAAAPDLYDREGAVTAQLAEIRAAIANARGTDD